MWLKKLPELDFCCFLHLVDTPVLGPTLLRLGYLGHGGTHISVSSTYYLAIHCRRNSIVHKWAHKYSAFPHNNLLPFSLFTRVPSKCSFRHLFSILSGVAHSSFDAKNHPICIACQTALSTCVDIIASSTPLKTVEEICVPVFPLKTGDFRSRDVTAKGCVEAGRGRDHEIAEASFMHS